MKDELKHPQMHAARRIFEKLAIDPDSRLGEYDQDFEYTSCETEELARYYDLYQRTETTNNEKRVLGCFLVEGLNDFVSVNQTKHALQDEIMEMLHRDIDIHHYELDYRVETDDPNEEHWWPIRKYILEWRSTK